LEIEGSADPLTDIEALRRVELNKQLLVQQWDAAMSLSTVRTNDAGAQGPLVQSSRKVFAFDKGASSLSSPVAYSATIPIKFTPAEISPTTSSLRAFADDKGATALMLIFAPAAAPDLDWERELLEAVEIAPSALPTLAAERARNVRAYLSKAGSSKREESRSRSPAPVPRAAAFTCGCNEALSSAHLPRYFDGLRIRSSRSVSDWRRASCNRRC
jgi:hypothetical protein